MEDFEIKVKEPKVKGSENMVQYLFNMCNEANDKDIVGLIRQMPTVYGSIVVRRNTYLQKLDEISKTSDKTPVVTADDIRNAMNREFLDDNKTRTTSEASEESIAYNSGKVDATYESEKQSEEPNLGEER